MYIVCNTVRGLLSVHLKVGRIAINKLKTEHNLFLNKKQNMFITLTELLTWHLCACFLLSPLVLLACQSPMLHSVLKHQKQLPVMQDSENEIYIITIRSNITAYSKLFMYRTLYL